LGAAVAILPPPPGPILVVEGKTVLVVRLALPLPVVVEVEVVLVTKIVLLTGNSLKAALDRNYSMLSETEAQIPCITSYFE
jgi:hypothetical protein